MVFISADLILLDAPARISLLLQNGSFILFIKFSQITMGVWGWMLSAIAREVKLTINVIANQESPRVLVTFDHKSDISGSAIGSRG